MTDKEFRKLTRSELIDIILEYQNIEKKLQAEVDELKSQLASKELKISEAGSLAEAVVGLNEIFEKAQACADDYLFNIRSMQKKTEIECLKKINKAQEEAVRIATEASKAKKGF